MENVATKIGQKIKTFRKKKGLTIEQLAHKMCKSKATVSKYERGEIVIDIETLYEVAKILEIDIQQLLYIPTYNNSSYMEKNHPAFFSNSQQFYSYIYDGRIQRIIRCVFDIVPTDDEEDNIYLYMNIEDYNNYQNCENTYKGKIEHFDAMTNITLKNVDTYMERVNISILASSLGSETKWGLFFGISSRPMMPIAVKMLFSRSPLKENDALIQKLKISKEDIRLLKHYNMLSAT